MPPICMARDADPFSYYGHRYIPRNGLSVMPITAQDASTLVCPPPIPTFDHSACDLDVFLIHLELPECRRTSSGTLSQCVLRDGASVGEKVRAGHRRQLTPAATETQPKLAIGCKPRRPPGIPARFIPSITWSSLRMGFRWRRCPPRRTFTMPDSSPTCSGCHGGLRQHRPPLRRRRMRQRRQPLALPA